MTPDASMKERALSNPSAIFDAPQQVLHAKMTFDEKKAILSRWKEDAMQLQKAADENMTGGEPSRLEEIVDALKVLERASNAGMADN